MRCTRSTSLRRIALRRRVEGGILWKWLSVRGEKAHELKKVVVVVVVVVKGEEVVMVVVVETVRGCRGRVIHLVSRLEGMSSHLIV